MFTFTQSTHFLIINQESFVMANYNYLIFFFSLSWRTEKQ
jgi:hypothetical protein